MNTNLIHCVYVTHHEQSGLFYIGKGHSKKILDRKYIGSGKRLAAAVLNTTVSVASAGTGRSEYLAALAWASGWKSELLATFIDSTEAYRFESMMIRESAADDHCLNDCQTAALAKRSPKRLDLDDGQ